MPANEETETEQEVLAPVAQSVDSATLALLNKSEIDTQIATAKKFARSLTKFAKLAEQLVTQDEETADECSYALPRGGKVIEGPSVRFAEAVAYAWGNCRCGARVISEDEEFVTAMGSFFDMEANCHIGYEVRRRITNRDGVKYNSDMIATTANAACSIALRNAILRGIPKPVWRGIYAKVRKVIAGDAKTLAVRRDAAIQRFQKMGIKPEQIFTLLGINGVAEITEDHFITLRGILTAIKDGDTTAERAFAKPDTQDTKLADKSAKNLEEIKQRYQQAREGPPQAEPAKPEGHTITEQGIEIGPLRSAPPPAEPAPVAAEPQDQESATKSEPPAEPEGASQGSAPPVPEPTEPENIIPPLDFGDGPKPKKNRREVKDGTHVG